MLNIYLKNKNNIRQYMRKRRQSLTILQQYDAAIKISKTALKYKPISQAKNIALFLSCDGEINTYPLVQELWLNNKKVFLPVINSFKKKELYFVKFTSYSYLYKNKYSILEPSFNIEDTISPCDLDIIIVPLVAFDKKGTRLGMGGGFYDTYLRNWKAKKLLPIGFSYGFQLINYDIPKNAWDVSLPVIIVPNKIWIFKKL